MVLVKEDVAHDVAIKTEAAGEISLRYYDLGSDRDDRLPLVMLHGGGPGALSLIHI